MKPGFYTVELVSIRLLSSFFVMIKKMMLMRMIR